GTCAMRCLGAPPCRLCLSLPLIGDRRAFPPFPTRRSSDLGDHPGVHKGMTLIVRQLQPGPQGLPLEIYCFTNTVAWAAYEGIQADRKSTRLNSSHVKISYAVFCLKKKRSTDYAIS